MANNGNGDSGWATLAKIATGFALGAIVSNETVRRKVVSEASKATNAVRTKVSEWKRKREESKAEAAAAAGVESSAAAESAPASAGDQS